MNLGDKIKEIRLQRKMTQEQLAKKAGISRVAIGNYERNDREPKAESLKKIADALDVDPTILLGYDEVRKDLGFISYLESLGYLVHTDVDKVLQSHKEDMTDDEGNVIGQSVVVDDATYVISISSSTTQATFTEEEFKALQQQSRANIDGAILLQSQKNKKEPPSAATENDSEDNG